MRQGLRRQPWLINLGRIAALLTGLVLVFVDPGEASVSSPIEVSLKDALNDCIASRSEAEEEEDYQKRFKLSDHCPNLTSALAQISATRLFDKALHDETNLDQLRDIQALVDSYHITFKDNQRFDYNGLQGLLASTLVSSPKPRIPWWHQFLASLKEWLKRWLTESGDDELRWLVDLLKWVTPSILDLIFRGAIILILALAMIVIVNELRPMTPALGRLRRRRTTDQANGSGPETPRPARVSWEEIAQLPPQRQPTALLRLVIGILIERGLLPNNQSLTNRELLMRLPVEDPANVDRFRVLVLHAESALYGDQPIAQVHVQGLIQTADALIGPLVPMRI
ncbi:MAG TPA: DUF4129 domain-containing protein [Nitrospira sp.]|nr:DUF4129 domain-containing protein [Nitrospira sp.]